MTGTAVKYKATKGTDSFNKYGSTVHVNTTMHCITAANNYSWKSMEELRFEDYSAGRKGSSGANGEDSDAHPPIAIIIIFMYRWYSRTKRRERWFTDADHQYW